MDDLEVSAIVGYGLLVLGLGSGLPGRYRTTLALDVEGDLVVVAIWSGVPDAPALDRLDEFAQELAQAGYHVLECIGGGPSAEPSPEPSPERPSPEPSAEPSQEPPPERREECEPLAERHANRFSLARPLSADEFNRRTRLVVLAPAYAEPGITRLKSLAASGIDVEATEIAHVQTSAGEIIRTRQIDLPGPRIPHPQATGRTHTHTHAPDPAVAPASPAQSVTARVASFAASFTAELPAALERRIPWLPESIAAAQAGLERIGVSSAVLSGALLTTMIGVYIATFGSLTMRQWQNFGFFGDLSLFDQALWLLSRFKDPFSTIRGLNVFGDHASYVLVLLSPLYWIWDDVRALLLFQTVALAIGALPVYWIALDKLKNRYAGLAFSLAYLLYPALEWSNRDHFHPETIATPALLFAFYYATKEKYLPFALFSIIAVSTREDVAIIIFLLGLYVAWKHSRKAGLITMAASAVWLVLLMKVLFPFFNGYGFFHVGNFAYLGNGPVEVIRNTVFSPVSFLSQILVERKLLYLLHVFGPVAFLPLFAPGVFFIAMPTFISTLISRHGYTDLIFLHYQATIAPFVFISSIYAVAKLSSRQWAVIGASLVLLASLVANAQLSPSPLSNGFRSGIWSFELDRPETFKTVLDMVPDEAVVSAHYRFANHFTHRETIYEYPVPFRMTIPWGVSGENRPSPDNVEYVVVDVRGAPDYLAMAQDLEETNYTKVFEREDIMVLRRSDGR